MNTPAELIESVYDRIFNLSLRFLGDPDSAKDATQEICVTLLTKIDTFRGESAFSTWALAVAANYLRTAKKSFMEHIGLSFEIYEADCAIETNDAFLGTDAERRMLAEELKHSCTLAMLQCLDRTDRLVYVLHAFFGISGELGSEIAGLSPVAYRQRLSRTRKRMAEFLEKSCGLHSASAPCHCLARVPHALAQGRLNRERLLFTETMERLDAETNAYRANAQFRHPAREREIRQILASVSAPLGLQRPSSIGGTAQDA